MLLPLTVIARLRKVATGHEAKRRIWADLARVNALAPR
jgi:hypothetical protein